MSATTSVTIDVLTIEEAAVEIERSASTVMRYYRAGLLPTVVVRGRRLVERAALNAFAASHPLKGARRVLRGL